MADDLRLLVRALRLLAALLSHLLLHMLWRIARRPSPWPRRFLGRCARIVGADPVIVGTPLRRDVVILANHLSWIDILLLASATGAAFVAKAELRDAPLVGWLAGLNHTLYVDHADRLGVAGQIARLRDALAAPWPIAIFPEGTTGDGLTVLPFKAALLGALVPPPPGLRVQPVRIAYGAARATLVWGEESGLTHALRVLRRPGRFAATLHFAEAFVPEGDRKAIAHRARAAILAMDDAAADRT